MDQQCRFDAFSILSIFALSFGLTYGAPLARQVVNVTFPTIEYEIHALESFSV